MSAADNGEVWDDGAILARAERSGQRLFTVGIGSAVAEAFVRALAERTGGACELISPREDMAERIVRHFRRMDQPRARSVEVTWPGVVRHQVPAAIDAVYGGDTLHLLAWLDEPPADHATLTVTLADGRALREQVGFAAGHDILPRVAAQRRLRDLPAAPASALAVRYQLVTEHTSCVLVHACRRRRETGPKRPTSKWTGNRVCGGVVRPLTGAWPVTSGGRRWHRAGDGAGGAQASAWSRMR